METTCAQIGRGDGACHYDMGHACAPTESRSGGCSRWQVNSDGELVGDIEYGICCTPVDAASSQSSRPSSGSSRSSSQSSRSSSRSSLNSSQPPVGGQCDGTECTAGGNTFCGLQSMTCALTNDFPCLTCIDDTTNTSSSPNTNISSNRSSSRSSSSVLITLAECTGYECELGGEAVCRFQNLTCVSGAPPSCFTCENVLDVSSEPSSTSSLPPLSCSGFECALGGDSFCAEQGTTCSLLPSDPCFTCDNLFTSSAASTFSAFSQQSSTLIANASFSSDPYTELFFLGEPCFNHLQCITNLCINNICVPCLNNNDCASGLCRNGICANTAVLADTTTDPSTDLSDPSLDHTANNQTLPAQIIELPFTQASDQWIVSSGQNEPTQSNQPDLPSAPSTPSTGPAALAVMLAGASAGWVYRRRS